MSKDLSKFKVISDRNIIKKLFYSNPFENNKGFYSLSLIPIINGSNYILENPLLSKTRDESYYTKLEQLILLDRSTQVDLTKYAAEGSEQDIELTYEETSLIGLDRVTEFDYDPKRFDRDTPQGDFEQFNDLRAVYPENPKFTGTISSPNSINFTGANSFLINQLIKPIIAKLPIDTYLGVKIYACNENFLFDLISSNVLNITIKKYKEANIVINTREDLLNLSVPYDYKDYQPRFLIEQTNDTDQTIFENLPLIGDFATIDNSQTYIKINLESQNDFLLFVPYAYPRRFSYNLDDEFEEILEQVENDGNSTLQQIIQQFETKFDLAKDQLQTILNNIKTQINGDSQLSNTMKLANIEGVLNFNLKEVEYYD